METAAAGAEALGFSTNGKRLRNCTGAECAKFGGWYKKIAAKVGRTKLVGAVLNEEEIRTIYARS